MAMVNHGIMNFMISTKVSERRTIKETATAIVAFIPAPSDIALVFCSRAKTTEKTKRTGKIMSKDLSSPRSRIVAIVYSFFGIFVVLFIFVRTFFQRLSRRCPMFPCLFLCLALW